MLMSPCPSWQGQNRTSFGVGFDGAHLQNMKPAHTDAWQVAGVTEDAICRDYALSRVGLEPARPFILPHIKETPEACVAMMSCRFVSLFQPSVCSSVLQRHSTMQKTLAFIRTRYGGAEEYLVTKGGLTRADCAMIRASLVVPV